MGAITMLVRSEVRRRPISVLGLAAIVALVAFVLFAGVAGAWRTASVLDRFQAETRTSDITVQALSPDLAVDPQAGVDLAQALAEVDGVTGAGAVVGFPLDIDGDYFMIFSSPDDSVYDDQDRPVVVAGRLPAGPDQIAVNQEAARRLDLDIGDTVSGPTLRAEDMAEVFGGGFPGFLGEALEVRVVGIIERGLDLYGDSPLSGPSAVASPEFASVHGETVGSYVSEVRLSTTDTSPALIDRVTQVASAEVGAYEVGVQTTDEFWATNVSDAYRVLAFTIAGFTLLAALAGLLVVAQAIGREVNLAGRHDQVAGVIGMARRERIAVAVGPAWGAVLVGVAGGLVAAIAASGRFPIGRAREAEVDPGIRVEPRLLLLVLLLLAILGGWSLLSARRVTRDRTGAPGPRRSRFAARVARLGARPSTVMGVRMAIEPGTGVTSIPVRSAIVGAVVAIAAVTSVAVVSKTAEDVAAEPTRYGWVWSTVPDDLSDDPEATAQAAAEVDGVDAVAGLWFTTVSLDGEQVPAAALEPLAGSMAFTQFEGRQPTGPSEVAIAPTLAEDLDLEIGDQLTLDAGGEDGGTGASIDLEVVGTVVGPPIDDFYREVVLSVDGLNALAQSEPTAYLAIRYEADASAAGVEDDLEALGYRFTSSAYPKPPSQVEQFRTVAPLLWGLILLVALLGALGLVHFLATTIRRRRGDLAVLRALGFTRRDVRRSITWQAVTAAAVGLIVGIPLGVAAGRTAWLVTVASLGIVDDPSTPWAFLAGAVAAGIVGSMVVSIAPGQIAARRSVVDVLRAE